MTRRRATGVLGAVTVAALGLSGCTTNTPGTGQNFDWDDPISISVNSASMEQMVLGEIYHQVLKDQDRSANLSVERDPRAQDKLVRLRESEVNFVVGCTGDMLDSINPHAAQELVDEYDADDAPANVNQTELSQRTYDEFVGSLSGDLMTIDPSPAEGCAGPAQEDLPQNIVPVFDKGLFDREEIGALNSVTRLMTTDELDRLVQRARRSGSVSAVVTDWRNSNNANYEQYDGNSVDDSDDD